MLSMSEMSSELRCLTQDYTLEDFISSIQKLPLKEGSVTEEEFDTIVVVQPRFCIICC